MKDLKTGVAQMNTGLLGEKECAKLLKAKVDKYLERAKPLFAGLAANSVLSPADSKKAAKMLDTAFRYYSDAKHFYEKDEFLSALTALEYAEGWMDAGIEIGFLVRVKEA